jgi:hypothetical protein
MLDSHPLIAIPPETHFIPRLAIEQNLTPNLFVEIITTSPSWPDFGLSVEALKQRIATISSFSLAEGLRAFYALYAAKHQKARWGDKSPPYDMHIRLIASILPEARFIHIIRDGRDSALSSRGLWFAPPDGIAGHAREWLQRITRTREQAAHVPHYREVRYEDLLMDIQAVLQDLCRFIEIDFSPAMLDYHRRSGDRLAEFASRFNPDGSIRVDRETRLAIHARTRVPPDKERIGLWRSGLTEQEVKDYETIAGGLLFELGYETKYSRPE